MLRWILVAVVIAVSAWSIVTGHTVRTPGVANAGDHAGQHLRAVYSPLHFKPAIESATDAQCLVCHKEVLEDKVRAVSPAGVKAADSLAWYQQVSTYQGEQDTFHRRHLVTPMAKQLMNLKCNTCHEGHDPREEAQGASATVATSPPQDDTGFTLRKQVNPETSCLKCHGQMNWPVMTGLTGPWHQVKDTFQNNCVSCHSAIRTNRHQVNYLNAEAIEKAGAVRQDRRRRLLRLPRRPPVVSHQLPLCAQSLARHAGGHARVGTPAPASFRGTLPHPVRNLQTGRTLNHETDT